MTNFNYRNRQSYLMFFIGLLSQTQIQVIGSIAISELVMFFLAPIIVLSHYQEMKREHVTTVLWLLVLAMVGCVLSSLWNNIPFPSFVRGMATLYGTFACLVCFWSILRKNPLSFKWYLLGSAISFVICTFIFKQGVESFTNGGYGEATSSDIISGPIYWLGRMGGFVMWPIQGFYMQTPLAYSAVGSFVFGAWALLTTSSGRSAALCAVASSILILIGRKSQASMRKVQRMFIPLCLGGLVFIVLFKNVYVYSASHGLLGEQAREKFEGQTKGKKDLLSVVKGGRGEFFLGAYAMTYHPIVGFGPWAIDREGIIREYIAKYGDEETYQDMIRDAMLRAKFGGDERAHLIGGHSCLWQFWLSYGILGLPFVIYLLYLMIRLLRKHIGAVPEFYGYFAVILPTSVWGWFFSAYGARINWAFIIAMLLLTRKLDEDQRCEMRMY